jgi:hypothetical protein
MPAVLREEHRRPPTRQPRGHRVKERGVLVGVDQIDPLAAQQAAEAEGEAPVDARPAAEHVHAEALVAQLPAEGPQFVEADEREPEPGPELPGQPGREDLGPADVEAVQQLTNPAPGRHGGPPEYVPGER